MRAIFLALLLTGCSSVSKRSANDVRPVRLELKGVAGAVSETRYHSQSKIKTYSDQQLLRDREESVDFTVATTVTAVDASAKVILTKVKTTSKDGMVELHDLAFPEKGEEIDYVIGTDGQIIKAGKYAPSSLFFVPSFPAPKEEVSPGDTWTLEHTWMTANEGLPLKLDIAVIFKALVPCGGQTCADLEISGHVKMEGVAIADDARFSSRVWGRMLFAIERGEVIWSEMRSQEEMVAKGEKMAVLSCMVSETKLGSKYKLKNECAPAEVAVTSVPKL